MSNDIINPNIKYLMYAAIGLIALALILPVAGLTIFDEYSKDYTVFNLDDNEVLVGLGLDTAMPLYMTFAAIGLIGAALYIISQPTYEINNQTPFLLLFGATAAVVFGVFEINSVIKDVNDLINSDYDEYQNRDWIEPAFGFYSLIAGSVSAGIAGFMGLQEKNKAVQSIDPSKQGPKI